MKKGQFERSLPRIFQDHLGLTNQEEDARWKGFKSRMRAQAQAWAFFMAAMMRNAGRLRSTLTRSAWAGRVGHIRWGGGRDDGRA